MPAGNFLQSQLFEVGFVECLGDDFLESKTPKTIRIIAGRIIAKNMNIVCLLVKI